MEVLIIILLILLNGIFSMSEIALVASSRFKLETAAKKGDKKAQGALYLSQKPNTFLSTVQIGITLIGILTGIFSGKTLTEVLQSQIEPIVILQPYSHAIAISIVVIVITYFSIVFGELLPKRIGLAFPEKIALLTAAPMRLISIITQPFIWLLAKTNNLLLGILGIKENRTDVVSEAEITSMIHESTISGEIQEIESDIVKRVFSLGDRKVRELMTHRTELEWFDIHDDLDAIRKKVKNNIHSVYPVANKQLDKLAGIIELKELFIEDFINKPFEIHNFLKKPLFVHENLPAYSLLEQLKRNQVHSAIIVDEYGAIEGLISIHDIFDALVGDQQEPKAEEDQIIKRDENSWLADGQYSFYEFLNYFKLEEQEDEDRNFTTLAGLILHHLNHIPVSGEKIMWKMFELEVVDMDDRRIDKILITKKINPENPTMDKNPPLSD